MTRVQKLQQLEELCQQRYDIIQKCYQTIQNTQAELEILEEKYLKVQALLASVAPKKPKRLTKIERLRQMLLNLGLENVDDLIKGIK